MVGQNGKWHDVTSSFAVELLLRHAYCSVLPFAVTSRHLPFAMLASHSEINCTSEQPGTGSCGVLNIAQFHNIASKSKRT